MCTANHPVFSTCLCDQPTGHSGEHSTLVKEKGAKYSVRMKWANEYFYSEQDESEEALRREYHACEEKRRKSLIYFNTERMGVIQEIMGLLRGEQQVLLQTGHGCACDTTGTCVSHAGVYNAINDAVDALKVACNNYHASSKEY